MSKNKKKKHLNSLEGNRKDLSNSADREKHNAKKQLEENRGEPETTTNMEAYHPHGNHHKRNFKDYIFEFIMIFVAITGGFFMENTRERIVEHHKRENIL